jgi:hypothetical protein
LALPPYGFSAPPRVFEESIPQADWFTTPLTRRRQLPVIPLSLPGRPYGFSWKSHNKKMNCRWLEPWPFRLTRVWICGKMNIKSGYGGMKKPRGLETLKSYNLYSKHHFSRKSTD